MNLLRVFAVALLAAVHAPHLLAQEPVVTPTAMGREAGAAESMVPYFIAGVAGGSGIGITSAHYIRGDRDETPYGPAIAGVAIVVGTGIAIELIHSGPPDPQLDVSGTSEYRQAFRERVKSRRRNALALGSVVGFATGVVIHTLLYGVGR